MRILFKEIKNEIVKIYSLKLTVIIIACIAVLLAVDVCSCLLSQYSSDNWKEELAQDIEENIAAYGELAEYLDEETYALLVEEEELKYFYIENDISPNVTVLEFVNSSLDRSFILLLLCILIVSKIFCIERSSGTDAVYTARSVKRRTLAASKIIASVVCVLAVWAAAFILSFVLGLAFFAGSGMGVESIVVESPESCYFVNYIAVMGKTVVITVIWVLFAVSLTVLMGACTCSRLASVLVPLIIMVFGKSAVSFIDFIPESARFLVFPFVLEYIDGAQAESTALLSGAFAQMAVSAIVYSALMLSIAGFVFFKRHSCGGRTAYKTIIKEE